MSKKDNNERFILYDEFTAADEVKMENHLPDGGIVVQLINILYKIKGQMMNRNTREVSTDA